MISKSHSIQFILAGNRTLWSIVHFRYIRCSLSDNRDRKTTLSHIWRFEYCPIVKTKIDNEKGSIYREKNDYIGKKFQKIDLKKLVSRKNGQMDVVLQNNRIYDVFYKTIPEIHWIYFSMFPKDRMAEVINHKVKSALEKVKKKDYSFRLQNIPEYVRNNNLVKSFNEMAEAIEIQHQQILDSQKRIVQAEKLSAIGTLAGGIAHDFSNILSSIIGFTELALNEEDKKSEIEDDLLEIYEAGKRAKELVSQILAFARQSEEETGTVSLASIAKEVLKLIRSSTPSTIKIKDTKARHKLIAG
jgi:signal transduction histidine kinase